MYTFLDEEIDAFYDADIRLGRLLSSVALLSVVVACLGLFGLSALMAEQRTKEIGIRKVLGGSVSSIMALLSTDVAKLVLIAFVGAGPLSYFAMERWLENFAYRIEPGWGTFVLAGVLAVVIALGTVSYQAVSAALADPVKCLRYE